MPAKLCGPNTLCPLSHLNCRLTWIVGALPPANKTTISVDLGRVINPSVNKKFMGCHHDYGFAQAPLGFYAEMLYGRMYDLGTEAVPSWTTRIEGQGSAAMAPYTSFSAKPSMGLNLQNGTQAAMVNRGIGGRGLYLQAGKPYTIEVWIWSGNQPTAFVELRDFTAGVNGTSLARQEFAVVSTGPPWGTTWIKYNIILTPSASTTCVSIPWGSDPTIDCGGQGGDADICQRCGGEFLVGIVDNAEVNLGYTSMMPGPWGLLQGPTGPLPVLQTGADLLTTMGVTFMRSGGSVSQSMRWKDWRGPAWNRPSAIQLWGYSLLSGWGPFEVVDMCNALGIEPAITLAYDLQDPTDWADLVEYTWGDATTSWGRRRIADGHPAVYNVSVFELGNEQYNPFFVDQVIAMEAASKAVGSPPLHYMFPSNGGLGATDAQRAIAAGIDVSRIMPDLHVGAGGAVEAAAGLFANPVVNGYNTGAINCETNAGTHDHTRALQEAADLLDWFTYDTNVTNRLYARTASFCTGTGSQFDQWNQGISFFLPNMTWYQPPGYVHIMISATWAEQSVFASYDSTNANIMGFAAQLTADGKTMVLRVVTGAALQPVILTWTGGAAAGPSVTQWLLTGQPGQDNTPSNPTAISPQQSTIPIAAGATSITATLQPNSFYIMSVPLQ
jgi:hypothetical protein